MNAACVLPDGFVLHTFERLSSTNDVARELAHAGAPSGQVVVAGEQTQGRGRYGRAWSSPPGNLYASILLRLERSMAESAQISLLAGLAMAEGLERLGPAGVKVTVKWPNDVLIERAKVAGVLLESGGEQAAGTAWVVIGSGVNIRHCPDGLPYPATTLAHAGFAPEVGPFQVLEAYVGRLDHWLERWRGGGFAAVREAWRAKSFGLGGPVTLRLPRAELAGRFVDLTSSGAMLLEQTDGQRREVTVGEVVHGGP